MLLKFSKFHFNHCIIRAIFPSVIFILIHISTVGGGSSKYVITPNSQEDFGFKIFVITHHSMRELFLTLILYQILSVHSLHHHNIGAPQGKESFQTQHTLNQYHNIICGPALTACLSFFNGPGQVCSQSNTQRYLYSHTASITSFPLVPSHG